VSPPAAELVCFESVYSMDGDIAPVAALCDVAERMSMTYLDECMRVGLYAHAAAGCRVQGVMHRPTVIRDLGKAFGVIGGYMQAPRLVDFVRSHARIIFTTRCPRVAAGALAGYAI